jgi:hypothetical protein
VSVKVITSVLVAATASAPANPYDLTDLPTVEDELGINEDDDTGTDDDSGFLQRAITQASWAIAKYCGRVFPVETVQDVLYIQQDPYPWQNPGLVSPLQVSRWPIFLAQVVAFTGNTNGTETVSGLSSTEGLEEGALVFASDGSIPLGTTIEAVGSGTITLSNPATSSETALSMNTGLQVVQQLAVGETQTLVYGTDFTVDPNTGQLLRLDQFTGVAVGWEAFPTTVVYQAGYDPIPFDLVDATLRLVTARYSARGRDPTLMERNQPGQLGHQRFWVGQQPGQVGSLPPEIESMVDLYRVPSAL